MKPPGLFELAGQWIGVICITAGASMFWGAVAAGIVRFAFDIEPGRVLLMVGLPFALIVAIYLFPRLWGILGFRDA
jgi:hypothetical protein